MFGFELPEYQRIVYCAIWALIDADHKDRGPHIASNPYTWPVQTTSPIPAQWKSWSKQNRAPLLEIPLWDMEELMEGYVFNLFSLSGIDPSHVIR